MKTYKDIEIKTEKNENKGIGRWVVTIKNEDWKHFQKAGESKILSKLQIPGFRKGSVPFSLAKKHIKETDVLLEAANKATKVLYDYCLKQIDNLDVKPINQPNVTYDIINIDKAVISYSFDLPFEIEITKYHNLAVKVNEIKVEKNEIDAQIKLLKDRFAFYKDKENKILEKGDVAIFDFTGKVKGIRFPGGKDENKELEIGSGQFIPGFEEKMIGMKVEKNRTITVKFPENYQVPNLANEEAEFDIYLKAIKIKIINDDLNELVKNINNENIKTPDDLINHIKEKITEHKKQQQKEELIDQLFDLIAKNAKIIIPHTLIKKETKRLLEDFKNQVIKEKINYEDYKKLAGFSEEEVQKEAEEEAISQLKRYFIIKTISEQEKINVEEQEVEKYLNDISKKMQLPLSEIKKQVTNFNFIYEKIKEQKIIKWLIDNNTIISANVNENNTVVELGKELIK